MRHGRKVNHLGRTTSHRKAMLANMAISLIEHKRITTTVAKAKALRVYVEPIITRCKENTTHNRRVIFSSLQNKEALKELFGVVSEKVATRPGGYCRIIKLGFRRGDNAEIAMIELVDFNETMLGAEQKKRSRRSKKKTSATTSAPVAAAPVVEDAPVVEETVAQVEAPEVQPETQNEEEQA